MTKVKLVDGPLCPGAFSPASEPDPIAKELWEKWRGKMVILGSPSTPIDWGCGTDTIWDVPEISADIGKELAVCRHMIEAGD